ncbi:TetR/AcrR family transcriptional regulator [Actinomyces oris]|uniref:TetR family transcriptional regulator n=1 Tax=Actinomyces oris TaxID=544580 RepID=A0A508B8G6_9ACTO|nr:TetR/AcrR family transcriptional regulator [Actinomyces oris]QQC38992.1 TetR/AcrR family transcriptional regulator [Actinomyces oris]TQD58960.1 TetR family transcriptional regulator [Actinomyces oris]
MPRVTAAYRERQTDRILQAAEECFARSGFQATSMDEVIAAAGMSSSTVYRYFPEGKRSLIRAVLTRRMGPLVERIKRIAESEEPLDFERDFIEALTLLNYQRHGAATGSGVDRQDDALEDPDDVGLGSWAPLAYHAWGELPRDPEIGALVQGSYHDIRSGLTRLCRNGQRAGTISGRLSPEQLASLIQSVSFGLIVEQLITGRADVEGAAATLRQLLAPEGT